MSPHGAVGASFGSWNPARGIRQNVPLLSAQYPSRNQKVEHRRCGQRCKECRCMVLQHPLEKMKDRQPRYKHHCDRDLRPLFLCFWPFSPVTSCWAGGLDPRSPLRLHSTSYIPFPPLPSSSRRRPSRHSRGGGAGPNKPADVEGRWGWTGSTRTEVFVRT